MTSTPKLLGSLRKILIRLQKMKYYQGLKRRLLKLLPRKTYTNLDNLPIKIWFDVSNTDALELLIIRGYYSREELEDIWTDIQQEYIDGFGLDPKYAKFMRLKKELVDLELELIITGKLKLKNDIDTIKADMEELSEGENRKFEDIISQLEKIWRRELDIMILSTMKYYTYLKNA